MKQKRKVERLEQRRKAYKQSDATKRPGSLKK